MKLPKYIVIKLELHGTTVTATNISDEVEDVIFRADRKDEPTASKTEKVENEQTEYRIGYYTPTNAEILKAIEDEQTEGGE